MDKCWSAARTCSVALADDKSVGTGVRDACPVRMYCTYMPNKTISVPDDVLPIIESLAVPFSTWVADQLRRHAATQLGLSPEEELRRDAALAATATPTEDESRAALARMDRAAPW